MNDLINIKDKDVISIVGSGGKTSLMYYLSKNILGKKILVSTTTKIKIPTIKFYDYIAFDKDKAKYLKENNSKGIYILANKISEDKLGSFELEYLEDLTNNFENVILEADGSKEKLIKAWNEEEPVILKNTTKTIGVLNLDILGKEINDKNVHRLERFIKMTNFSLNEEIDEQCLIKIIIDENGLFKNAMGEKILFINGAESLDKINSAIFIAKSLIDMNYKLDYIVIGSISEGKFWRYD